MNLIFITSASLVTKFECNFRIDHTTFHHDFKFTQFYECNVKTPLQIEERNSTVIWIIRSLTNHIIGRANDDVTEIFINRKIMYYLPTNFGEIFPNIEYLAVWNSKLKKVEMDDLKQFPNLKYLCLKYNDFTILGENVFKFVPKLEYLSLFRNKIKEVHPTAFNGLTELKTLNMRMNDCVNKEFVNSKQRVQEFITNVAYLCQFKNEIGNFTEIIEDANKK